MEQNKRILVAPWTAFLIVGLVLADRTHLVAVTLVAAFLHECGHLWAAYLMNIPLRRMRIDLFGARLELGGRMLAYGEEWLLCAAGPFASLSGAALGALLWDRLPITVLFSCASLLLGVLNLLPIRGFDGGRMLCCALSFLCGERAANRALAISSALFLFLLWAVAVYFLLRAGDGLSLFCFSFGLFLRFFENERL